MENISIKTEKLKLGKLFIIAWIVVGLVVATISVIIGIQYSNYSEGQDMALLLVETTMGKKNTSNHEEKVRLWYKYFNDNDQINELEWNESYLGIDLGSSKYRYELRKVEEAFEQKLNELGYPCTYGSYYFRYVDLIDYSLHTALTELIIAGSLVILLLFIHIIYLIDKKRTFYIDGDFITCQYFGGKKRQFILKEVTGIETAGIKGLMIRGNGIKIKVNLVKNRNVIQQTITNYLAGQEMGVKAE